MLQSIRDRTQGWIAGIIISVLILSFALWGIHSYTGGSAGNETIASVNGVALSLHEYNKTYERFRRQLQMQLGSEAITGQVEADLKRRAMQMLITVEVLKQASMASGYRISTQQIDNFLEGMPELQVNGQFSAGRFQQLLTAGLFTANEFIELIRTTLLTEQPRLGIIFSSFSLPNEVTNTAALINQKRTIYYTVLPQSYFLKQNLIIPSEKIEQYYTANKSKFTTPELVSIDYIQLSVKDLAATFNPTIGVLRKFYNENSNSFVLPMQWKLEKILIPITPNASNEEMLAAANKMNVLQQKIKNGEDFSILSRQYSGATRNKSQNWVTVKDIQPELQNVVMPLRKIGLVSTPIKTSEGLVLVKVTDFKGPQILPFEQVKDKVKETIVTQQAQEKFAEMREKLANITYEHPESLDSAAKALNLKISTSHLFSKNTPAQDISQSIRVREAAFTNDVLISKNNSDLIQLDQNTAIVLRVNKYQPAAQLPLTAVEKRIQSVLLRQEVDSKVAQLAEELSQKLQNNSLSPDQIASQYHLTWNKLGLTERHSNQVDSAIVYAAFRLPHSATNSQKLSYTTVKVPNGYAIVTSPSVKDGTLNNKSQNDIFAEQVQNSQGLLEYELYKQSLLSKAKVKFEKPIAENQ